MNKTWKKINQRACYNSIWSWSPMPCGKHGPRASVTTKTSAFGLGFCLLSPSGHVFHTAWETMIKSYIIACWWPFCHAITSIITWLCDILALVWHFGPACVTFRPGLCDILALSCVTKASACHHTPILTTGAVYRKFHRSSVSKTT